LSELGAIKLVGRLRDGNLYWHSRRR